MNFYKLVKKWQNSFAAFRKGKPIVSAIHGGCLGGGIDLICSTDIRLCTKDAYFSVAEVKVGIVADLGTLQVLSRIVGSGAARHMALTGGKFTSSEAQRFGLVTEIFEDKDKLIAGGRAMAALIASHSPRVTVGTKEVLNYSEGIL